MALATKAGLVTPANKTPENPANQSKIDLNNRIAVALDPKVNYGTTPIYITRIGAAEVLPSIARMVEIDNPTDQDYIPRMYSRLKDKGISMSELLDAVDPADGYTGALREMDGYERQLYVAGIKTRNIPEKNVFASRLSRFFQSSVPGSQVLFPEFINRTMRQSLIAPDILSYILATTTNINAGEAYRTIYTNDAATDRRMYRVDQLAELPQTTLKTNEHLVRVYKYGRLLVGSYEFFERTSIDLFAILLSRMAMQSNLDKALTAVDVAINGDGNSNAATNYNQSSLDTGTVPTYAAYLNFALGFFPYTLNVLVGNAASLVKFITMTKPTVDPLAVLAFLQNSTAVDAGVSMPQQLYQNLQLVYLPDMPTGVLLGLDKRYGLEMVVENGSNIVETDRIIRSQKNEIAISERVGFAKIFNEATKTWTWNA